MESCFTLNTPIMTQDDRGDVFYQVLKTKKNSTAFGFGEFFSSPKIKKK